MSKTFLGRGDKLSRRSGIFQYMTDLDRERGAVISVWAIIEGSINHANSYAWHYSKKTISAVVPINLQRKIALFEKIHRELLPFEPLREQAGELTRRLKAGYEVRHWMAHGYLLGEGTGDGVWPLTKDEFLKDGSINTLTRTFTRNEFTTIRGELIDLSEKFAVYTNALVEQVDKHPSNS